MGISLEELQLAARNHGLPLEALRHPVTPVGLHHLLTHFDVPEPRPEPAGARRGRPSRASTSSCAAHATVRENEQPLAPGWNVGGYANNAVQRVPVTVRP